MVNNEKSTDKSERRKAGHSFEDYIKRALNPLLVLHLLSEQSMYVYQMQQQMALRSQGRYTLSLLYPVIYRLVEQKYVREGERRVSTDNRVRLYYEITQEGREYLEKIKTEFQQLVQAVQAIIGYVPEEGELFECPAEPILAPGGAIFDGLPEKGKA